MHAWGLPTPLGGDALALTHAGLLPSDILTPSAYPLICLFGAKYSAYIHLCLTLRVRSRGRPRMTRGQDGSLLLSCMTLSFTTPRRVDPDAPKIPGKSIFILPSSVSLLVPEKTTFPRSPMHELAAVKEQFLSSTT